MSGGGTGRLGAGGGDAAAARATMLGGGTLAPLPAAARSLRPPAAPGSSRAASGSGCGCSRALARLTHTSGMAYSTPARDKPAREAAAPEHEQQADHQALAGLAAHNWCR